MAAQPLPTAQTTVEDLGPTKPYQRNNQQGVIHQRVKTNPRGYVGGTTERALEILDNAHFPDLIKQAIKGAKERAEELAKCF